VALVKRIENRDESRISAVGFAAARQAIQNVDRRRRQMRLQAKRFIEMRHEEISATLGM
jgi:hypothetical protein